jgi:hypothetical protein
VNGRTKNKGLRSGGIFRSKLKSMKIKCFECDKRRHFRKNYLKRKGKEKKEKTSDDVKDANEKEISNDTKSNLAICVGRY